MPKQSPTTLLDLPHEVLLLVAECLDEFRHLYAFLRTNRRLSTILKKPLYQLAARSGLEFGLVALLWAAASQDEQMLRVLLLAGSPRITIKDQHEKVLCLVSHRSIPEADVVAQILSECTTIKIRVKKGRFTSREGPALQWAAKIGNKALIRLLLDKGADILASDRYGHTALHYAAAMNQGAAIQLLLSRGAERHVVGVFGETPVDRALLYEHPNIVLMLLDGADVNARYQFGRTALHIAAGYPIDDVAAKVVESLLKKGADVGAVYKQSITPIYSAVFKRNIKVVKLLLEAGAWAYQQPGFWSIIQLAMIDQSYDIARLLLETVPASFREPDQTTPLHLAITLPETPISLVTLLLDKGIPIDAANFERITPLHRAIQFGYVDIVKLLLERGANMHIEDARNTSTLIYAAAGIPRTSAGVFVRPCDRGTTKNMLHIAELLLHRGAKIDTQDVDGRTAMHHAVLAGGEAMVKLLLEFGPDLSLVDSGWQTPADTARANITGGYEEAEIFKRLLRAVVSRRVSQV